jgi:hypothetical protein
MITCDTSCRITLPIFSVRLDISLKAAFSGKG